MDREERKAWVTALATTGGYGEGTPVRHVFDRVAALIAPAEVEYAMGDLRVVERGNFLLSGRMLFFTQDVLVIVDVKDMGSTSAPGNPNPGGSADLRAIPRRSLRSITMAERQDGQPSANRSDSWAYRGLELWPPDGELVLKYDEVDALTMRSDGRPDFQELVSSLTADLAAST